MKRHWDEHELAERWSLTHDEFELLRNRTERRICNASMKYLAALEREFAGVDQDARAIGPRPTSWGVVGPDETGQPRGNRPGETFWLSNVGAYLP